MEDILPGTETSPEDGLKRTEAAQESEARLIGILPEEELPPGTETGPTEASLMGEIPPRTEEARPVLTLGPPDPARIGGRPLDRTQGPMETILGIGLSLERAHGFRETRAAPLPEEVVPATTPC